MATIQECCAGSEALRALARDFEQGRLPHALLLTGESGVGKRTLAHLLAQGLLCTSEGQKPCGQCRECRRYAARTHPDAYFPAPAPREKTIKVDTLRSLIDALSRHSLEGNTRVVVIENAERMTPQAQNSLLKTLEEAGEGVTFFLTADAETAILPTVRSRCRCVRLEPWPRDRLLRALTARGIGNAEARKLAGYCEGSLGRALAMQADPEYWRLRQLVEKSFLAVRKTGDIPAAAALMKDEKDQADELLDILEQEIRLMIHQKLGDAPEQETRPPFDRAGEQQLRRLLEKVLDARKRKAAYVSWPALSEGLMQNIVEELSTWQP